MVLNVLVFCFQSSMKKKQDKGSRQKLREEMKFLRKELRQREEAATRDILQRADVVLATLTSAHDHGPIKHLDQDHFDLVVIDECSQVGTIKYCVTGVFTGIKFSLFSRSP